MMWGGGWEAQWPGWIFMIVVLALLIGGIAWLVRAAGAPRGDDHGSARRLLDERFAAGEIDAGEYEQRRRALR
jgi:putative membrane protein